jgi:LacI family transcriptional regulator
MDRVRRLAGVREVASAAGVSMGTVSNAINNPQVVSAETRARIEAAMSSLNFVPNGAARQLRKGVSETVGLVVLDFANPFFVSVIRGAERRASQSDLTLLFAESNADESRERKYIAAFQSQGTRGLLVAPAGAPHETVMRLKNRGLTWVLLARRSSDSEISSVAVDDVEGGRLAVAHLLGAGRTTIAFVGGPMSTSPLADRLLGARIAIAHHGHASLEVLATTAQTFQAGLVAGKKILERAVGDRPSGIFAANDLVAAGMLAVLNSGTADLVPRQIALIGYDDISFPFAPQLPLTSVRQPSARIGDAACELLLGLLDGSRKPEQILFQPEVIIRRSTIT